MENEFNELKAIHGCMTALKEQGRNVEDSLMIITLWRHSENNHGSPPRDAYAKLYREIKGGRNFNEKE